MTLRMQVDGGSNTNILTDAAAAALCRLTPCSGTIGGIGGGLRCSHLAQGDNTFGTPDARTLSFLFAPHGRNKNILSESVLLDGFGIQALKQPPRLTFADGFCPDVPMTRINGLYYVDVTFRPPSTASSASFSAPDALPLAFAAKSDDVALLWSTRLGTNAEGLLRASRMARGINIEKLSQLQREAIDSSIPRAIAQAKHAPVYSTPMHARATAPGETLICDGFGLHHAPSPVDGAVYQFHAIDEYSSFGYTSTCKTHTTEDWIHFLRQVKLDAEKHGHKIVTVRFDRAPELRSDELKRLVAEQLGILVDLSPREHHEAVGRAERNNDVLTREAERMLQLAGLGTQWLLPARTYAQWLRNRLAVAGMPESRYQRYLRQVPDLSAMIPYTFGTTVAIVEDVRGPKGSLDHPRGSTGRFIGISGSSYLVYRDRRATVVHQSHVRPLNELALVRGSLPASVATVDTGTTMGTAPFELDGPVAPPTASPSKAPLPTVDVPIGTRIDVRWKSRGGREADAWWLGEVIAVRDYGNGRRRHRVAYEGFDEDQWYWHDLASDDFEWRPAVAAPTPDAAPARPPQGRYPLRNRAQASAAEFIECALESCQASNALESFNAAVFQAFGDAGAALQCSHATHIPAAFNQALLFNAQVARPLGDFSAPSCALGDFSAPFTCHKATQRTVDVVTELGPRQFHVPSNARQVEASEQRDEWLHADRQGLDVLLAAPGNRLVPIRVPLDQGIPIGPCVTQRKIKIDQHTHRLAERKAFSSRHCLDGARHSGMLRQAGQSYDVETASTVADDVLIKCLVADAAVRRRRLLKADVPNAYSHGKRLGRPLAYMSLPDTLADELLDDEGRRQCIELCSPTWGEGPSGFEWQVELESTLTAMGWRRAEGVPALWRFVSPDADCLLITIVDDMLFSESGSWAIAERTCKLLTAKYGDVRPERTPTSFAGYSITHGDASITLSMSHKVIEAAREHLPELLSASPPPDLPSGSKLHALADAMQLVTPRPAKLTRVQRATQQLCGSLKFVEKVQPRISLLLHRVSCVMSCPPPEAYDVARAALKIAFEDRDVGITFGGGGMSATSRLEGSISKSIPFDMDSPAPSELEAHADATWSHLNLYALVLTYGGAAVFHQTKKIAILVDSSMETECIASSKAAEIIAYVREILRAFGTPPLGPTLLTTDNLSNQGVASGASCPSRSKHFLRRYHALQQRIRAGECTIRHINDAQMPADALTKWVSADKLKRTMRYLTNSWA